MNLPLLLFLYILGFFYFQLSTEITDPEPLDKTNTAYAKIFVELDEEQKKFSIETEVDRAFICGDGSKTDEEVSTPPLTLASCVFEFDFYSQNLRIISSRLNSNLERNIEI